MGSSVTVITVTLNASKFLPQLIESLRGQSDRDFEFLIVDGGSTDGTNDIISAASDVVTYAISERDEGFYDALNKAILLCKTDYYITMGADDFFHPDAIENYKRVAAQTDADIVVADVKAGRGIRTGYHPEMRWMTPSRMYTSHSVGTMIRTSLHQRFGNYPMKYVILADSALMKRMFIAPDVKTVSGGFLAGEFSMDGISNVQFVRSLCELWLLQRDTGENPLMQFLLFQIRLVWNLRKVVSNNKQKIT